MRLATLFLVVTLGTGAGYTVGTPNAGTVTIMDNDGLVNLLEYAIGTNGTISSTNPQVTTLAPISADKYLRISIPKNPAATDVTYTVEACSDLSTWSSVGLFTETNTTTQLIVRDNIPAGPGVQRFMRVRVTRL